MSTIWTPSGERPIPRDQPAPERAAPSTPPGPGPGDDDLSEEELRARMVEVQAELVQTPAAVVVANHCIGLYQLAALHLEQQPPNLSEAQVAIDALAAVVDTVGSRFGEDERALRDAVANIRMAFVQVKAAVERAGSPG